MAVIDRFIKNEKKRWIFKIILDIILIIVFYYFAQQQSIAFKEGYDFCRANVPCFATNVTNTSLNFQNITQILNGT
jgi:hypothetical protein